MRLEVRIVATCLVIISFSGLAFSTLMATLSCPQSRLKAAAGHKWGVGGDFNAGVSFGNLLSPYFVSLDLPCPTSPRWSLENMSQSPRIKNIKVKTGFCSSFSLGCTKSNLRILFLFPHSTGRMCSFSQSRVCRG